MGSHVLAYPMYQHIKRKYPEASLYVLLFKNNREILELLDLVPTENILTIDDRSIATFVRDIFHVLALMRKIKFEVVIDCELFARISSLLSFWCGAKIRVGFHPYTQEGLYRGDFINRPVLYNPYHHISRQFINLVEAIDSNTVPTSKRTEAPQKPKAPSARLDAKEIDQMKRRLYQDFRQVRGRKLVLIYPGGGILPIRAWPLSYFCTLSTALLERGYVVGVIGLDRDKGCASTILAHCRNERCIDLTGYTKTVRELMAVFHLASLLITNDGGPGQFAAMTNIPSIIFYGPETPVLYGPLDEKAVIFYGDISCSPCLTAYNHRNSPCDGDNLCLKSIRPERVISKAMKLLED